MAKKNDNELKLPSASDILGASQAGQGDLGSVGGTIGGEVPSAPQGVEPQGAEGKTANDIRISQMQAQIAALTQLVQAQQGQSAVQKLPKVKQYTAKVTFLQGKNEDDQAPIVAFGKVKVRKVDGDPKEFLKVGVLRGDKIVEEEVDYLDFMQNAIRYESLITGQSKTKETKHQGPIPVRHVTVAADPMGFSDPRGSHVAREITLEHEYDIISLQVKLLEGPWKGKELKLNAEAVNRT